MTFCQIYNFLKCTKVRTTPFDQYFLGFDFFAAHLSSIFLGSLGVGAMDFASGVKKGLKKQDRCVKKWKIAVFERSYIGCIDPVWRWD